MTKKTNHPLTILNPSIETHTTGDLILSNILLSGQLYKSPELRAYNINGYLTASDSFRSELFVSRTKEYLVSKLRRMNPNDSVSIYRYSGFLAPILGNMITKTSQVQLPYSEKIYRILADEDSIP